MEKVPDTWVQPGDQISLVTYSEDIWICNDCDISVPEAQVLGIGPALWYGRTPFLEQPLQPAEIVNGIYLGDHDIANDVQLLRELNIDVILSLDDTSLCAETIASFDIYHCHALDDFDGSFDIIAETWPLVHGYIQNFRKARILEQCCQWSK